MAEINPMHDWKSEKDFMQTVKKLAEGLGWLYYHTYNSRHSDKGYPDCHFVRDGRQVFAELKFHKGKKGEPTIYQQLWLDELSKVPGNEVFVWHPKDWEIICDILR